VVLGLALLASACSGEGAAEPSRSAGRPRCDVGFAVPAGFQRFESFSEPYADHLGVRLGFRDQAGRELHVFSGIPGEFGEGLPPAGSLPIVTGEQAVLLGQDQVWVLSWDTRGPCSARAVLGDGFPRPSFVRVLEEAGVVKTG
jgi:hypothetical protein